MKHIHQGSYTDIFTQDEPDPNNHGCHSYVIQPARKCHPKPFHIEIPFQHGPVNEQAINGCHNEDLIHIVIDRLTRFQSGPYRCDENQQALDHLHNALASLHTRTQRRKDKGIEGTSTIDDVEGSF